MRKLVCLGALIMLIVCFTAGCWQNENNRLKSWEEWVKIPLTGDKKEPSPSATLKKGTTTIDELASKRITVKLYFARRDGKGFETEKRDIVKQEGIARKTVEALLAGPQNSNLRSVLPAGTRLLDINIRPDGLCIVNFNRQITEVSRGGQETMAVYSVVNTLCQFPSVKKVSFMVEGAPVDTLAGDVDLSRPVMANYEMGQ